MFLTACLDPNTIALLPVSASTWSINSINFASSYVPLTLYGACNLSNAATVAYAIVSFIFLTNESATLLISLTISVLFAINLRNSS